MSSIPSYTVFIYTDEPIPASHIQMSVEEHETIRLIDYLGWNQEECAKQIQTSGGGVQSLCNEARHKLSRFLMEGSATATAGGSYQLNLTQKPTGDDSMKIAVTYDNGQVFQYLEHTQMFKFYGVTNQGVIATRLLDTNGGGYSALVTLPKTSQVDTLICSGTGGGMKNTLAGVGIELHGGARGDTDAQAISFLNGDL